VYAVPIVVSALEAKCWCVSNLARRHVFAHRLGSLGPPPPEDQTRLDQSLARLSEGIDRPFSFCLLENREEIDQVLLRVPDPTRGPMRDAGGHLTSP